MGITDSPEEPPEAYYDTTKDNAVKIERLEDHVRRLEKHCITLTDILWHVITRPPTFYPRHTDILRESISTNQQKEDLYE